MKIGIYSPYLDTLSGGERYMLTMASHWGREHAVDILWSDSQILSRASERFGQDYSRLIVRPYSVTDRTIVQTFFNSVKYDVFVYLSDGSIPLSFARKNILHFQAPIKRRPLSLIERLKLKNFGPVIVNSHFTKGFIDETFGVESRVIYPPVPVGLFARSVSKKPFILSVGRFAETGIAKSHEILISAFRRLLRKKAGLQLHVAGGLRNEDSSYFERLQRTAKALPVWFHPNASHDELKQLYLESSVYWHAAGFNKDPLLDPENCEHFGISVVESMAAGCIACVYAAGGPLEIITDNTDGFLWKTTEELIQKTIRVFSAPVSLSNGIRAAARMKAERFDEQVFCKNIDALLSL